MKLLYGFGIAGFKSFGPDVQLIAPLSTINIFVGQNNTGKSNTLKALARVVASAHAHSTHQSLPTPDPLDAHMGTRSAEMVAYLPRQLTEGDFITSFQRLHANSRDEAQIHRTHLMEAMRKWPISAEGAAWFGIKRSGKSFALVPDPSTLEVTDVPGSSTRLALGVRDVHWKNMWRGLNPGRTANLETIVSEVVAEANPWGVDAFPMVRSMAPFRKIGDATSDPEGLDGQGIIRRLAALQSPEFARRPEDLPKFRRIVRFIKDVTGAEDAHLEVPDSRTELLVRINGKELPVQELGTGIHQVIIFAIAAMLCENMIVCIEEPETHLHPRLQRRLLSFLAAETSNQYFITTHSAHLIDTPDASVFHVSLNEHQESVVRLLTSPNHRASVCFDLGYRPSDIVQANCVVWVEGPSDRVYLNAWLARHGEHGLVEGLHYSIMFYGGRLLSHLTVSDEVSDFIDLQRLNRRVAIVMDSDKKSDSGSVGTTKLRVEEETRRMGGFVWITAGREIENYIPTDRITAALATMCEGLQHRRPRSRWDKAYLLEGPESKVPDKIALARAVASDMELNELDLPQRLDELVAFIANANS